MSAIDTPTEVNDCPNCGPGPCYHICPNSPHYYSLEQEMADEANYDPSEYYREAGFYDDLDAMAEADEQECRARDFEIDTEGLVPIDPQHFAYETLTQRDLLHPIDPMNDDIPF